MADLQKIFDKYRYDPSIQQKSKNWFQQQANLLRNSVINTKQLFKEQKLVTRIIPGKLYMFYYDPKLKNELPYYDTFPLVFPYSSTPDGFIGLNMHYLPCFQRVQLMTKLLQFANTKNFDESTRIKYSWQLISGVSKFKMAEPCIKQYLKTNVKSMFIEIPGSDWHTAMMLPVEKFVGSTKSTVWGESLKP